MSLIDMCPVSLRKVLKEREHRLTDYALIRTEISDWIADNAAPVRGRAAALGEVAKEIPEDGDDSGEAEEHSEAADSDDGDDVDPGDMPKDTRVCKISPQ